MSRFLVVTALFASGCDFFGDGAVEPPDQFSITNPSLIDDSNRDGIVHAGERGWIELHLNNEWNDDWMAEVGVHATVDNPGVVFLDDEPVFFGIFGNTSADIRFIFDLDPSVPPGTVLNFDFEITAPGCVANCPGPNPIQFQLVSGS